MTSADPNFFPRRPAARLLAVAAALGALLGIGQAAAQDYRFGWDPRTGDVWVDTWLDDVNRYGGRYQDAFVDELVRYHGAPRDLVLDLLVERGWAPGDVYYACAIARIIGRPCRYVADEWARDHGEGWGALAQRLGIKPGSDEFMRLKRGFVPTYDRWGRPIRVDDDLARFYPQRERMRGNDRPGANGRGEPHRGYPGCSHPSRRLSQPPRRGSSY